LLRELEGRRRMPRGGLGACSACGESSTFSKNQRMKPAGMRRCRLCVSVGRVAGGSSCGGDSGTGGSEGVPLRLRVTTGKAGFTCAAASDIGLRVTVIDQGGAAEAAGVTAGMVCRSFQGRAFSSWQEVARASQQEPKPWVFEFARVGLSPAPLRSLAPTKVTQPAHKKQVAVAKQTATEGRVTVAQAKAARVAAEKYCRLVDVFMAAEKAKANMRAKAERKAAHAALSRKEKEKEKEKGKEEKEEEAAQALDRQRKAQAAAAGKPYTDVATQRAMKSTSLPPPAAAVAAAAAPALGQLSEAPELEPQPESLIAATSVPAAQASIVELEREAAELLTMRSHYVNTLAGQERLKRSRWRLVLGAISAGRRLLIEGGIGAIMWATLPHTESGSGGLYADIAAKLPTSRDLMVHRPARRLSELLHAGLSPNASIEYIGTPTPLICLAADVPGFHW
jgi:hypothetical protein